MSKTKITYQCGQCDYISPAYLGKCPECGGWGSLIEKTTLKDPPKASQQNSNRQLLAESLSDSFGGTFGEPVALSAVTPEQAERYPSGFPELDRVLGGGVMPGGYFLLGGDPGIGKSTLMLQMAGKISAQRKNILYVAGEESPYQIKLRADRLGINADNILIFAENNLHQVIAEIKDKKPSVVIIDSVQAMYLPELSGTPGSVGQIRECAGLLMSVAKSTNTTIFLVGHVTKDGAVSGPKLLEHTVDAVLYFEGEKYKNLRILRSVKNRFGTTQEIGVFEIGELGLQEVKNPSELFLSDSSYQNHAGSVIACAVEGSRPILVEIQALVGQSAYATPRRVGNGIDQQRLHQIVAVLERRLGLNFSHQDIYVNVVGGLRIDEPAADLGIALSIITSFRNISMREGTVVCGEIGLTGEVRPISQREKRMAEAEKIGFTRMILPAGDKTVKKSTGKHVENRFETIGVRTLMDAICACLPAGGDANVERVLAEEMHPDRDPARTEVFRNAKPGDPVHPRQGAPF